MQRRAAIKAFTLIELLIVTIVLAILAAIVIPAFQNTTDEPRLSTLSGNLTTLRKAIDLYHVQHGHYPGAVKTQGTCTAGANLETATPGEAAFVAHLTLYSTKTGIACTQPGGASTYGPYLRAMPVNPMTEESAVKAIHTGSLVLSGTGTDNDGGWLYDFVSGRIIADQPSYQDR